MQSFHKAIELLTNDLGHVIGVRVQTPEGKKEFFARGGDGVTYAVQCKRYNGPVGVEAVLRTYGGLAYYERMVGVVMTNQYFTSPAVEAAKKLHILLWDRGYMDAMIEEGGNRQSPRT